MTPTPSAQTVTAEHTPTPWKVGSNSFNTQFIYGDLSNPRDTPMGVSYFNLVAGGDHYATLTPANAAFIVEAINNHATLISSLAAASERIVELEKALLNAERGGTFEDVLANYRSIRRNVLDDAAKRALSQTEEGHNFDSPIVSDHGSRAP